MYNWKKGKMHFLCKLIKLISNTQINAPKQHFCTGCAEFACYLLATKSKQRLSEVTLTPNSPKGKFGHSVIVAVHNIFSFSDKNETEFMKTTNLIYVLSFCNDYDGYKILTMTRALDAQLLNMSASATWLQMRPVFKRHVTETTWWWTVLTNKISMRNVSGQIKKRTQHSDTLHSF